MNAEVKDTIRYSEGFKQKVVKEIEEGKFRSKEEARKTYGIRGTSTITKWIKEAGKNHLIGKVIRVEMIKEKDRIKELEKKNIELERALAKERLNTICYEGMLETAREIYGIDIKKKTGNKV